MGGHGPPLQPKDVWAFCERPCLDECHRLTKTIQPRRFNEMTIARKFDAFPVEQRPFAFDLGASRGARKTTNRQSTRNYAVARHLRRKGISAQSLSDGTRRRDADGSGDFGVGGNSSARNLADRFIHPQFKRSGRASHFP